MDHRIRSPRSTRFPGFSRAALGVAVLGASLSLSAQAVSFKAGEVDVNVGGYAKLDVTYMDPGIGLSGTVITAGSLPAENADDDGNIDFSARESRFWIKTAVPTDVGTLKTMVEGDFYGSGGNEYVSNSYGFRLRHAFGELNGWLMGQTWSTFMDLSHLGEILDFGQHKSTIFIRQSQVRYTHKTDNGSLQFALENPQSYVSDLSDSSTVSVTGGDVGAMPDVVARWNVDGDWGHASIGVMGRQFKVSNNADTTGAAASLTAKFKLPGKDDLRVQINGGALGRYMGLVVHPGATFDGTKVEALDSLGASIAYRHFWSDKVRSTLMVSATEADLPTLSAAQSALLAKSSNSVHLNVLWDVAKQVRLGFEVQRAQAKMENGSKKELDRIQFSSRYMF